MSPVDKAQLKRRIQDLPEGNLVRVAEILQCSSESDGKSVDQMFANFNEAVCILVNPSTGYLSN